MRDTLVVYPINDCGKGKHISIDCEDYPCGSPILAIKEDEKVLAEWKFADANEMFEFAFVVQEYAEGLNVIAAREKNNS